MLADKFWERELWKYTSSISCSNYYTVLHLILEGGIVLSYGCVSSISYW